ncbi:MAG: hypothetical protein WA854_16920 [Candidatus Binataceae bacterium]
MKKRILALIQAAAILFAMTAAAGCFMGPSPYWYHHQDWHYRR